jgi:hypothetical protein
LKRLFDIEFWSRALRSPIVWVGLIVDLLPVYAVFAWGWDATPLVLLYWVENVIIGVMTLPRILVSGARMGLGGALFGLFIAGFFTIHYGMFCTVHGVFLVAMAGWADGTMQAAQAAALNGTEDSIPNMIEYAMASAPHADWIVAVIAGFQVFLFVWQFIGKGEWRTADPGDEMGAPYGRIVLLHLGLFVGFGALIVMGQPMAGVLALILAHAVWGVFSNGREPKRAAAEPEAAARP